QADDQHQDHGLPGRHPSPSDSLPARQELNPLANNLGNTAGGAGSMLWTGDCVGVGQRIARVALVSESCHLLHDGSSVFIPTAAFGLSVTKAKPLPGFPAKPSPVARPERVGDNPTINGFSPFLAGRTPAVR